MKPAWLDGLDHGDWLLDGRPIRGKAMLARWDDLDWSSAYVDMGPSIAGNEGPYWHVLSTSGDTGHRLYPKILRTKWLSVIRQAVKDAVAQDRSRREAESS